MSSGCPEITHLNESDNTLTDIDRIEIEYNV